MAIDNHHIGLRGAGDVLGIHGEMTWKIGTPIPDGMGAVEAGVHLNMLKDVRRFNFVAVDPDNPSVQVPVDDHFCNMRLVDTPEGIVYQPVGYVSKDYRICPERWLAETMDILPEESHGECRIATAGVLDSGRRIFFTAHMGGFNLGGDATDNYLVASNTHDGSSMISFDPFSHRIECLNTLRALNMGRYNRNRDGYAGIKFRHMGTDVRERVAEIRTALSTWRSIAKQERENAERLAEVKVTRDDAVQYFGGLYADHYDLPDEPGISNRSRKLRERKEFDARQAYLTRLQDESQKFGGMTMWLAMNAWTGTVQHDIGTPGKDDADRRNRKVKSALYGVVGTRTTNGYTRALELVTAS